MRLSVLAGAALIESCNVIPAGGPPAPPPAPVQVVHSDEPLPPDDRSHRGEEQVVALPAPRPAWEVRPVIPDARMVETQVHVVRPGDTLGGVAEKTGAGAEAIAWENGLARPFVIRAGQRLRIPAGRYHLVRPGETGIAIARAYGVDWSRIVAANRMPEPYVLRVGQRIVIPGVASPAERAAAFRLDIDDILTGGEPALASGQAPAGPVATPARVLPATAAVAAPAKLRSGFAWPVEGRVVARFGPGERGERNNGVKIAVPAATPIKAAADGVVAYVGGGVASLGGVVIVRHGEGWTSIYGHASKLLVRRGQSVKRGDTLALAGETGSAERPEVHFELRKGRTPVDPLGQLPRT